MVGLDLEDVVATLKKAEEELTHDVRGPVRKTSV
jgi:hypothetical protein